MKSKSMRGIQLMRMVYLMDTGGAIAGNPATLDELLGPEWVAKTSAWRERRAGVDWNRLLGLGTMLTVSVAGWTGIALLVARLLK